MHAIGISGEGWFGTMQSGSGLSNDTIIRELQNRLGEAQVVSKRVELEARAGDASIYRMVPRVVVSPRNADDVRSILGYCREAGLPMTFRTAGTSLSGQAVTDGVLVDVAKHWKGIRVLDRGVRVAVEPGVIGVHVNAHLAKYGRKMGPDPASINSATMGGIAANNASGMCSGVSENTYSTMAGMKLMLADGFFVDTADADADEKLRRERPQIYDGLLGIRDRIRGDREIAVRIRRKYEIKNTCGYGMNAFMDFDRPVDILAHLMIGSEGTLGFIAEVTLDTLVDKPLKAATLVYFKSLVDAGAAIAPLVDAGAAVLEVMDRAAMRCVADQMNFGFEIEGNCAALLVEFQEMDEAALEKGLAAAGEILKRWPLFEPVRFARDAETHTRLWNMRKGLFPSVCSMRPPGTAVIIEDVCVRPAQLAECIQDLQSLFAKHGFPDTITFGHAKNGNLHFVICTDFASPEQLKNYSALMGGVAELIAGKYDASVKAEHGTGRNVAPFVGLEWGTAIYELMWEVKRLLDPDNVLSPGVLLERDPEAYLRNLKAMPEVSPSIDKCIECGFCEPTCPARNFTITARQRIQLSREIKRLRLLGGKESMARAAELLDEYDYYGIDTCAADGLCALACPVKIDTGSMVKDLRCEHHSAVAHKRAVSVVRHFGLIAQGARLGLTALRLGGYPAKLAASCGAEVMHKLTQGTMPRLPMQMPVPHAAPSLPARRVIAGRDVVYFPSCLTRSMGKLPGEDASVGVAEALIAVLEKCGWSARIPGGVGRVCCGQPFTSKGFVDAARAAATGTTALLWEASRHGQVPVVCDTSPCSWQIGVYDKLLTGEPLEQWRRMKILDFPAFMAREVLPARSDWPCLDRTIVLHPTCTVVKQDELEDLRMVASTFASKVHIPMMFGCCAFAGDKGFNIPQFTLTATRPEATEVKQIVQEARAAGANGIKCYSTCRTCEIGMTAATQEIYQSIVYLCYDALVSRRNGR